MRDLKKKRSSHFMVRNMAKPAIGLLCMLLILTSAGCGGKSKTQSQPQIKFVFQSTAKTNEGKTFYVVFRSVSDAGFLTDTYNAVAALMFAQPQTPDIIATHVVFPGKELEIKVPDPGKSMAVYCLFTKPGAPWKTMLQEPFGYEYVLTLGENNVANVEKKEHGFIYRCAVVGGLFEGSLRWIPWIS